MTQPGGVILGTTEAFLGTMTEPSGVILGTTEAFLGTMTEVSGVIWVHWHCRANEVE
jgi:hypothetical protein